MPEGASFYNRNARIHSIYSLVQTVFSDRKNSNKMPLDATLLMRCSGKKVRKGLFKMAWVKAMECKTQKYSPLVTVESGNEWKGIAVHEKYSANCRTCCCFNSVLENKRNYQITKGICILYMNFSLHAVATFPPSPSICSPLHCCFFVLCYLHAKRIGAYFCMELSFPTWNLDLLYIF